MSVEAYGELVGGDQRWVEVDRREPFRDVVVFISARQPLDEDDVLRDGQVIGQVPKGVERADVLDVEPCPLGL